MNEINENLKAIYSCLGRTLKPSGEAEVKDPHDKSYLCTVLCNVILVSVEHIK